MAFRMTLRRIVPTELMSLSVDEQIAALGFLTYTVVGEVIAGRDPTKSQMALAESDPQRDHTSRRHAKFAFAAETGKATVADLESTNGTFVNGNPMQGEHPLRNGDVVAIGQPQFTVEIVDLDASLGHTVMGGTAEMTLGGGSISVLDLPDDGGNDGGKSMIG